MKDFFQKMIAFFLALLSALGISLKAPSEPALKLSDDDTYSVSGSTVTFALSSNPSTGYSWTVQQEGNSVKQTKIWYESDQDEHSNVAIAGRGGTEFFTFTAQSKGKSTVTFIYERPWEKDGSIKSYVVSITVAEDLTISDVTVVE